MRPLKKAFKETKNYLIIPPNPPLSKGGIKILPLYQRGTEGDFIRSNLDESLPLCGKGCYLLDYYNDLF